MAGSLSCRRFSESSFWTFLAFFAGCTVTTFPCENLLREAALPLLLLYKGEVERGRVCFSKACLRLCLNREEKNLLSVLAHHR